MALDNFVSHVVSPFHIHIRLVQKVIALKRLKIITLLVIKIAA